MCGITGVFNFDGRPVAKPVVERMTREMAHRGPDDAGLYVEGNVGLGMRRLSIIDVAGGHQPIASEDGATRVIGNGEIYNYRELRAELAERGHRFTTNSDIETILHAYEEYGDDCVHKLRGMFAFAVWDSQRQRLLLARDRLGIKPLYYRSGDDRLIFASEIKPILAHPGVAARACLPTIYEYLTLRYVIDPRTVFAGILKLPPGHMLTCRNREVQVKKYWDAGFEEKQGKRPGESIYAERLRDLLKYCVQTHLMSDVPLGAFLSGGLDSSCVVGLMSQMVETPIKTYSVGFGAGKPIDELEHARQVARYFHTDHHELTCESGSVELLEKIIHHLEEPIADPAVIPTYLVSELASRDVKVVLTGEGSDETNGGYDKYAVSYRYGKLLSAYSKLMPLSLRKRMDKADIFRALPAAARLRTFNAWSLSEAGKFFLMSRSLRPGLSETDLFTPDFLAEIGDVRENPFAPVLEDKGGLSSANQFFYLDIRTWLPNDLLLKVDKMAMAHSLEARVPYLDHKFVEFSGTVPPSLKLRDGVTKYLLRQAMKDLLPPGILRRKQHGFNVPIDRWFRGELKGWLLELINDRSTAQRGYINRRTAGTLLKQYLAGDNSLATLVWSLVMLELWHRKFID
jgi:asparagine synthase (glutamine-hydrolysing)